MCVVFVTVALALWGCGEPMEAAAPAEVKVQEAAVSAAAPWVTRHGLTAAQYQAEFNHWMSQGYRLTWVTGYEEGGAERFAAIWELTSGPAWVSYSGMTSDQYQSTVVSLWNQGYRLVLVNGYSVGGQDRFVAIFHADWSTGWVARHNLTSAQYQSEFNYWSSQGYRLTHVSGYTSYGAERYAAIWVNTWSASYQHAFHALTPMQYTVLYNQMTANNYRLAQLSTYNVGGTDMYAGFFLYEPAPPLEVRHGLSREQHAQSVQDLRYQGYRPVFITAHNSGGTPRFTTLWQNLSFSREDLQRINSAVEAAMSWRNMKGLSLAVTRNGKLVFAKAYGQADASTPMNTSHRFRLASVSKPLTAIGIMRLVQSGRLNLDQTVFGRNGVLGELYSLESAFKDPRVASITVRQLLAHWGGGWDNNVDDGSPDPMFDANYIHLSHSGLISSVLKNVPLDSTPGTLFEYSNFGYCVLGRIIERVSGKSYESFMRDEVLTPSGATSPTIGWDASDDRLPNEVAYHDQQFPGSNSPYMQPVRRMDAHGGWISTPVDLVRIALRVDGFSTVPDLLTPSALSTMTTPYRYDVSYGLGWFLNNEPNWWHDGYFPGTTAMMARLTNRYGLPYRSDAFTWSILTNSSNGGGRDTDLQALYNVMWNITNNVQAWPSHDLF